MNTVELEVEASAVEVDRVQQRRNSLVGDALAISLPYK